MLLAGIALRNLPLSIFSSLTVPREWATVLRYGGLTAAKFGPSYRNWGLVVHGMPIPSSPYFSGAPHSWWYSCEVQSRWTENRWRRPRFDSKPKLSDLLCGFRLIYSPFATQAHYSSILVQRKIQWFLSLFTNIQQLEMRSGYCNLAINMTGRLPSSLPSSLHVGGGRGRWRFRAPLRHFHPLRSPARVRDRFSTYWPCSIHC